MSPATANVEKVRMSIGASGTNINIITDTRTFLCRKVDQLLEKQSPSVQHMTNLFVQLHRHVSALQTAAATSIKMQLENEILINVS